MYGLQVYKLSQNQLIYKIFIHIHQQQQHMCVCVCMLYSCFAYILYMCLNHHHLQVMRRFSSVPSIHFVQYENDSSTYQMHYI